MTDFVKNEDGSGWAVRVSGEVRPDADADTVNTSLIFHVAMERAVGSASKGLMCERLDGASGRIAGTECRGKDDKLGPFVFRINADPKYNVIKKSTIRSRRVGEDKIWQAKCEFSRVPLSLSPRPLRAMLMLCDDEKLSIRTSSRSTRRKMRQVLAIFTSCATTLKAPSLRPSHIAMRAVFTILVSNGEKPAGVKQQ